MPQRCSIPGCKTGYKQGLMLLCYPKDPERRMSWVRGVRKAGLEPTNMQFICELHFGPDQWEKIRVDGTRKLKWSGVPNMFSPEEVASTLELVRAISQLRERPQGPVKRKGDQDQQAAKPEAKIAFAPNVIKRVVEFEKFHKSSPVNRAKSKFQVSIIKSPRSDAAQCVSNEEVVEAEAPASVNVSKSTALLALLDSKKGVADVTSGAQTSDDEVNLPLSSASHSIVVKLPKSRFQNSLMEDLDDIRSFLNDTEHTYEQRLINTLAAFVKKHQVLDERLKRNKDLAAENSLLKEKLQEHQNLLVENYRLKERIQKYETKSVIENVILRGKLGGSNGAVIVNNSVECVGDPTPHVNPPKKMIKVCEPEKVQLVRHVTLVSSNSFRDQDGDNFVSLDDQL